MATPKKPKRGLKFSTVRGVVAIAVIVFVVLGLIFRIGSGTLSAFGIEKIAAICPLGALEVMLGAKEVLLHPLILFIVVIVVVVITGKAFCGWMCPTPWIQKFFHPKKKAPKNLEEASAEEIEKLDASIDASVAEHLDSNGCGSTEKCGTCGLAPVGGKRDGLKIDGRHGVLIGALLSSAVFGFPVFCLICPVGLTFALIIGIWNAITANDPSWALVIIPVILLLELVFFRKWCHKFCPMGALISLVSGLNKTFKPKVEKDVCLRSQGIDCHACVDACPEQLDPHSKLIPECTKCGACVEACPSKAVKIKALGK